MRRREYTEGALCVQLSKWKGQLEDHSPLTLLTQHLLYWDPQWSCLINNFSSNYTKCRNRSCKSICSKNRCQCLEASYFQVHRIINGCNLELRNYNFLSIAGVLSNWGYPKFNFMQSYHLNLVDHLDLVDLPNNWTRETSQDLQRPPWSM